MVSERELLASVPTQLWIGGPVDATGGATFPVENPATGETLAEVADATPEDAVRALDAAVAVQDEWAATPARQRGEILRAVYEMTGGGWRKRSFSTITGNFESEWLSCTSVIVNAKTKRIEKTKYYHHW